MTAHEPMTPQESWDRYLEAALDWDRIRELQAELGITPPPSALALDDN